MTILKTIQEVNDEREREEVFCHVLKIEQYWKPMGIKCPCGCDDSELMELLPRRWNAGIQTRIRCPYTGKTGMMIFDGSVREIIRRIDWDDLSGIHFGEK